MGKKEASALLEARDFWSSFSDGKTEPMLPDKFVPIRDICHALEILLDNIPDAGATSYDSISYSKVIDALEASEIVAHVFGAKEITTIPGPAWSTAYSGGEPEAFDSMVWHGVIQRNEHCRGFVGSLPVVDREQAERWLNETRLRLNTNHNPSKIVHEIAKAYWRIFPAGHEVKGISQAAAQREVQKEMGKTEFSRRTFKTAIQDYSAEGKKVN